MASMPRIDSPCPLSRSEQLRINGYCSRCDRNVHALDGLNEAQRRALLAAARAPLCVSYRVPVSRGPALGTAMAVMLSAGAAIAGQDCDEAKQEYQSIESAPVTQNLLTEEESEPLDMIIMVGGIESPEDASWVDEGRLPDLPMVEETESGHSADSGASVIANAKRR